MGSRGASSSQRQLQNWGPWKSYPYPELAVEAAACSPGCWQWGFLGTAFSCGASKPDSLALPKIL